MRSRELTYCKGTNGSTLSGDSNMNDHSESKTLEGGAALDAGRRNLLKLTGAAAAAVGVASVAGTPAFAQQTLAWDKKFPQSDGVDHQKVSFYNRLGISLVSDLYIPTN